MAEDKRIVSARGGYHNPALVNWEVDKEMPFSLTHGVLTPRSWAILSNSKLTEPTKKNVPITENLQATECQHYCYVDLKFCPNHCEKLGAQPNPFFEPSPMGRREELMLKPLPPSKTKWIFCYDIDNNKRIQNFQVYQNRIFFQERVNHVMVDYTFEYEDKIKVLEVGNRLLNGFLRLEGKMSVKDQESGQVSTAILELPKIKLSSSLSISLGRDYSNSTVSNFYFIGYPDETKRREEQSLAYINFLDIELTGEYI